MRLLINLKCLILAGVLVLLAGCAQSDSDAPAGPNREQAFTFVVMGDNRPWGSDPSLPQPKVFLRSIEESNRFDPDFVVINGDLIWGYAYDKATANEMWDNFDKATAKFETPFYLLVGNHDTNNDLMEKLYLKRYGKQFPLYYSFNHGNSHFIILDSDQVGNFNNIGPKQLAWLERDLKANGHLKTFVFLHRPLWGDYLSNWNLQVHPLLARYNVDTVFCGHFHGYTKRGPIDGVRYIVTGGSGAELATNLASFGRFYHYLVVTVRGDDTSIAVVRVGNVDSEDVVTDDSRSKAKDLAESAFPIRIRVPRHGQAKAPGTFTTKAHNPFDQKFEGQAVFTIPQGSTWSVSPTTAKLELEPGQTKELTYTVNSGKRPSGPMPRFTLTGTLNSYILYAEADKSVTNQPIAFDTWPYQAKRRKFTSSCTLSAVVADPSVDSSVRLSVHNPLDEAINLSFDWKVPKGWTIEPAISTQTVEAGKDAAFEFKAKFIGPLDQLIDRPRLSVKASAGSDKAFELWRTLQVAQLPALARRFPPQARCVRAKTAPVLDGKLDDPVWSSTSPLKQRFVRVNAVGPSDFRNDVRFLYDDENLYVAGKFYEPNMDKLVANGKKHDGDGIWSDDLLELFLDPAQTGSVSEVLQFSVNPAGVAYDAKGEDPKWNKAWTHVAGRERNSWTVELAIPWKSLEIVPPGPGDKIKLNVCRTHAAGGQSEYGEWALTFELRYGQPEYFGTLNFE